MKLGIVKFAYDIRHNDICHVCHMTFGPMTFGITTFCIMTFGVATFDITALNLTISVMMSVF